MCSCPLIRLVRREPGESNGVVLDPLQSNCMLSRGVAKALCTLSSKKVSRHGAFEFRGYNVGGCHSWGVGCRLTSSGNTGNCSVERDGMNVDVNTSDFTVLYSGDVLLVGKRAPRFQARVELISHDEDAPSDWHKGQLPVHVRFVPKSLMAIQAKSSMMSTPLSSIGAKNLKFLQEVRCAWMTSGLGDEVSGRLPFAPRSNSCKPTLRLQLRWNIEYDKKTAPLGATESRETRQLPCWMDGLSLAALCEHDQAMLASSTEQPLHSIPLGIGRSEVLDAAERAHVFQQGTSVEDLLRKGDRDRAAVSLLDWPLAMWAVDKDWLEDRPDPASGSGSESAPLPEARALSSPSALEHRVTMWTSSRSSASNAAESSTRLSGLPARGGTSASASASGSASGSGGPRSDTPPSTSKTTIRVDLRRSHSDEPAVKVGTSAMT